MKCFVFIKTYTSYVILSTHPSNQLHLPKFFNKKKLPTTPSLPQTTGPNLWGIMHMCTLFELPGIIFMAYQLSKWKIFWSHAHPTFSPTFILMIHIPEKQTQHYLRQIIIAKSISYYYCYYYYYITNNTYYYYRIILNVYKTNKPRSMCKVSHFQYHSLWHHYLYQLLINFNCCWHVSDYQSVHSNCLKITHKQ